MPLVNMKVIEGVRSESEGGHGEGADGGDGRHRGGGHAAVTWVESESCYAHDASERVNAAQRSISGHRPADLQVYA
jgi:hypothetical protein